MTTNETPRTATIGVDDSRLSELYGRPGPFVTAYLDADTVGEEPTLEVRWKNLRRDLDDDGAPEHVLDAVERTLLGLDALDATLVVVANDDGVQLDAAISPTGDGDLAVHQQLPRFAPMIAWRDSQVPYVAVMTDRLGADIAVVDADALAESVTVEGSTLHVTRSAPGGWSQRRYQQRAENQWERNAAEVADQVARAADDVGAAFIAVAGDVRAVGFLQEHLGDRHLELLHQVRGGRQPGDDLDGTAEDVVRLQATAAAERVVRTLEEFASARAASGAVDGPDATFESLQRGLVGRLLVVDDLAAEGNTPHCWICDDPLLVSTEGSELRALGHSPRRAPLVDAAIRAALAQGGEVVIVPAHGPASPRGGLGAVLRG